MKRQELVEAYEAYIDLLCKELDEVCSIAHVHGWKSSQVEEGKKARARIKKLSKEV